MNQKLYIIYGIGNDTVGLVGKITSSIAGINGNIIDLRQDVMHGLFTIFLVVDLGASTIQPEELKKLIDDISNQTGLRLSMDKYLPYPRSSEIRNLLLILLGYDRPGIIAAVSETLGSYNINIEFSQMIARENIFLMDLLVDIRGSVIPLDNLKNVLKTKMQSMGISTMFQCEDVFNKKKKIIIFDISSSFIGEKIFQEIAKQANISRNEIQSAFDDTDVPGSLRRAASRLDSLPVEVMNRIIETIEVSQGTVELIQTLKIMGYKIGLLTTAFSLFTDTIQSRLGIDYSYGFSLNIESDSKTISGILEDTSLDLDKNKIITSLAELESISGDDVMVLSEKDGAIPGIRLDFNMKVILDYYNSHILSRESILGVLGSFGVPKR